MLKRALMLTSGSLLQTNPLTSYSRETAGIVVFLILELHSQTLLEPSLSNSEKDKYYAVDYVNNYYIGRAVSAPTERQFTLTKFLHKIQQTEIKSFGCQSVMILTMYIAHVCSMALLSWKVMAHLKFLIFRNWKLFSNQFLKGGKNTFSWINTAMINAQYQYNLRFDFSFTHILQMSIYVGPQLWSDTS